MTNSDGDLFVLLTVLIIASALGDFVTRLVTALRPWCWVPEHPMLSTYYILCALTLLFGLIDLFVTTVINWGVPPPVVYGPDA